MFNFLEDLITIIADRIIAALLTQPLLDKNLAPSAAVAKYKRVLKEIDKVDYNE